MLCGRPHRVAVQRSVPPDVHRVPGRVRPASVRLWWPRTRVDHFDAIENGYSTRAEERGLTHQQRPLQQPTARRRPRAALRTDANQPQS